MSTPTPGIVERLEMHPDDLSVSELWQAAALLKEMAAMLERSQYLFAHGVGAMTGDAANQERNVRAGGELMREISTLLSTYHGDKT